MQKGADEHAMSDEYSSSSDSVSRGMEDEASTEEAILEVGRAVNKQIAGIPNP